MAAGDGSLREAIRVAQAVLIRSTPSLIADGRWGGFTEAAYGRAPGEDQVEVDSILSMYGTTASELNANHRAEKASKSADYFAKRDAARESRSKLSSPKASDAVKDAIRRAAALTGVPENEMMGMALIESGFNPVAAKGSSRGLFQIQPKAWTDVLKVDPSIGPYSVNWKDPYLNAVAAGRYRKLNERWLRLAGFTDPITPAILYLAHQQGAAGLTELWSAFKGYPQRTSYVTVKAMTGNPPQDRLGVTTDKAEFYRRWLAVAEKKVGATRA